MEIGRRSNVNWRDLFSQRGFRYFFVGVFVSIAGSGLNFAGVCWFVLTKTNSTVQVSLLLILLTLPGLVVPFAGGVLIDRLDRRYLGMAIDLVRGAGVAGVAALVYFGHGGLATIYAMEVMLGIGAAVFWSNINALVQEVIPRGQLVAANSAVMIAVQGGVAVSGAFVGFVYDRAGIAGILALDAATYFVAVYCLFRLRRGYFAPHSYRREELPEPLEVPLAAAEETALPPLVEPGLGPGFFAELKEGFAYLRRQPKVLAIGTTYACMIAGVLSGNVLVVALTKDILNAGAWGYGLMESGWAVGAVAGGLATAWLARRFRPATVLLAALAMLALGHALFPYVRWLSFAVVMNAVFGASRALGGVLTQSALMTAVPRRLMGRTQSAFAFLSTILQVAMSFALGWLAQRINLAVAFLLLGIIYGAAAAAAYRARSLTQAAPAAEPG
jgi:DHA3 family macrolide efflux protein-like MFS transporter